MGFLGDCFKPYNASFFDTMSLRDGIGLLTFVLSVGYLLELVVLMVFRDCPSANSEPIDYDYRVLSTQEFNTELCGAGLLGQPRWVSAFSISMGSFYLLMGYYGLFTKDRDMFITFWYVCMQLQVILTMAFVYTISTFASERTMGFFWASYRYGGSYAAHHLVLQMVSYFLHLYMVYLCWSWFKLNRYELPNGEGDEEEEVPFDQQPDEEIKPVSYPAYVDPPGVFPAQEQRVPIPGYNAVVENEQGNSITEVLGVLPKASPEEAQFMSKV